jgi:hypothetical protein
VFDAACFARCGRDIFWRPDLVSNEAGAAWLQRHLGPNFRVHRIAFREATPTDRVYAFGGGFHCCTVDIRRDGRLESYFPTLDVEAGK